MPAASGGLNVIGGNVTNLVGLGGCNPSGTLSIYAVSGCHVSCLTLHFRLGQPEPSVFLWNRGAAKSYRMARYLHWRVRNLVVGVVEFSAHPHLHCSILTVLMMMFRIKGSILIGIFITSIISWPRSTAVTYFPNTTTGDQLFDFFKQVVTWHPLKHTGNALDVSMFLSCWWPLLMKGF